jgi:carboxynorspermidine decarboxylase
MIHYTMVKTTTFNGVTHPHIAIWRPDGKLDVVRKFGYNDYKRRLS